MKSLYAIVGMRHRGSEAVVAALPTGAPLMLVREPDNDFDPNAVQVWTVLPDGGRDAHVGFLKATQVRQLARWMDENGKAPPDGQPVMSAPAALRVDGGKWPMAEVEQ